MTVVGEGAESVAGLWSDACRAYGDRLLCRHRTDSGPWRTRTVREADAMAREVAAGLVALGIRSGATVAILSATRWEWIVADIGILLAGATSVPLYPSSTPEQCALLLEDSGATIVIAEDQSQLQKLRSLGPRSRNLRIVCMSDGGSTPGAQPPVSDESASISWDTLRELGRAELATHPDELDGRARSLETDSVFTIIYTSGTTGTPKGVVLTHGNLLAECSSARRGLAIDHDDVQYLFLPLAHVLGRMLVWSAVSAGALTVLAPGPAKMRDDLLEIRPTFMVGVPLIFEKLHAAILLANDQLPSTKARVARWALAAGDQHASARRSGRMATLPSRVRLAVADRLVLGPLRARLGLDRCRFLASGGAPLAATVAEFFHGIGLLILEGYGLTETTGGAFMNRMESFRFGSVGQAIDVVEARIADDGEILLRGPTVFARYHNQPAATAQALDAEGWLHTGDIGTMHDGFLRITDRKKDLIVSSGGQKVAPLPLESALRAQCPAVSQVMVHGDGRPHCVALFTLSAGAITHFGAGDASQAARSPAAQSALQAAIDQVNASVAKHQRVRRFAIIPQDFTESAGELTPSLKIKRRVIVERYASEISRLYDP